MLRRALWQDLPRHTVLELSGVSFMAAAGLRVLEEAAERAHLERRRIAVVATTHPVTRDLRLAGFDRTPVYPRLADAVRELAGPARRGTTPLAFRRRTWKVGYTRSGSTFRGERRGGRDDGPPDARRFRGPARTDGIAAGR